MRAHIDRLTSGPAHHLFGYYGIPAWSPDGTVHAALETDFHRRPHGVVDASGTFIRYASTSAFNLQQGAMMFWLDTAYERSGKRELSCNAWRDDGRVAKVVDMESGEERTLDRPLAAVSRNGSDAIGLDFARMYHCRSVVGYASELDGELDPAPTDDGLFAVDPNGGRASLLLPLSEIAARSNALQGDLRLSSLWSIATDGSDLRCDLHPRWSRGGRSITFRAQSSVTRSQLRCTLVVRHEQQSTAITARRRSEPRSSVRGGLLLW